MDIAYQLHLGLAEIATQTETIANAMCNQGDCKEHGLPWRKVSTSPFTSAVADMIIVRILSLEVV